MNTVWARYRNRLICYVWESAIATLLVFWCSTLDNLEAKTKFIAYMWKDCRIRWYFCTSGGIGWSLSCSSNLMDWCFLLISCIISITLPKPYSKIWKLFLWSQGLMFSGCPWLLWHSMDPNWALNSSYLKRKGCKKVCLAFSIPNRFFTIQVK